MEVKRERMTSTSGQAERLKRVDPLERVLNLYTLLHRLTTPLTREQIVAQMARGMTPYPVAEAAQRQLFGSDKNTIVRILQNFLPAFESPRRWLPIAIRYDPVKWAGIVVKHKG